MVTLDHLATLCGPAAARGGLLAGLFAAGLAGSALHCAPMCGGFVLGQVSDRMARLPSEHLSGYQRLLSSSLLPYHFGRLTTYSALGFAPGGGGFLMQRLGGSTGIFLLLGA